MYMYYIHYSLKLPVRFLNQNSVSVFNTVEAHFFLWKKMSLFLNQKQFRWH